MPAGHRPVRFPPARQPAHSSGAVLLQMLSSRETRRSAGDATTVAAQRSASARGEALRRPSALGRERWDYEGAAHGQCGGFRAIDCLIFLTPDRSLPPKKATQPVRAGPLKSWKPSMRWRLERSATHQARAVTMVPKTRCGLGILAMARIILVEQHPHSFPLFGHRR